MTTGLILILVGLLLVTTFLSALNLALGTTSATAIERRCALYGRVQAGVWILAHATSLEHAVAFFRTFGRLSCMLVVLAMFRPSDPTIPLEWPSILMALATASILVWLTTSVIAVAIARYGGVGLVIGTYPILRISFWATHPILWVGGFVDEAVRRLLGALPNHETIEQDLIHSITDSARAGGIDALSARIIQNAVEFHGTVVSEVMTPRTQIEGIAYTDDIAVIRAFIETAGHSRVPVYQENMDQVVGILYFKDLVRFLGQAPTDFKLRPILRQPPRVPETKPVSELLSEFQRTEVHLALVVDEFGGTAGLITIEDVLEEIVGEIYDEHEPSSEIEPQLTGNAQTGWETDGRIPLVDIAAATALELPTEEDFDTIAGLILLEFGRIPLVGEAFSRYGARFTVLSATPVRVVKIRIELLQQSEKNPESASGH